jgi:hypothetical protein
MHSCTIEDVLRLLREATPDRSASWDGCITSVLANTEIVEILRTKLNHIEWAYEREVTPFLPVVIKALDKSMSKRKKLVTALKGNSAGLKERLEKC